MSARDDLLCLLYGERPSGMHFDDGMYSREEDADEILSRHARELAEKQRAAAHIARLIGMDAEQAVRSSADLIDPEVQS